MWIEEVSIDGFKSYAKRVVVHHFDRSFNAITGLNGSGKSNILDALCFVLGIKNLSSVCPMLVHVLRIRARSWQPVLLQQLSLTTSRARRP